MNNILFFGLGRIGLPQSLLLAKKGFTVYGYDIHEQVIEDLSNKQVPFYEKGMQELMDSQVGNGFYPVNSWKDKLSEIDVVVFALGTTAPDYLSCLNDDFRADAHYDIIDSIFEDNNFKKGIVLIFRTTLPVGTVESIRNHIEKKFSLVEGTDFHIAFVPERLVEGNAVYEEENLPKIIGAYSDTAYELIADIFKKVGGTIVRVSSPTHAELCKLIDNSFRNTMFSYANEIALFAQERGIDIIEIINAVNTEYKRNTVPLPGYVSGYCLGKDPYIFEMGFHKETKKRDFQSIWYYGRRTNDYLIDFTCDRILNNITKSPADTTIAILGLSFKKDIDDFRMSHSIFLMEALVRKGFKKFNIYDPYLEHNKYTQIPGDLVEFINKQSDKLTADIMADADVAVVATNHTEIADANNVEKIRELVGTVKYIFDGWNIWRKAENIETVKYEALGYQKNSIK